MTRTIQNQLIEKGLSKKKQQKPKKHNRKNEKMSKQEIEELMGVRRPTYRRNRGAFRQS